MVETLAGCTYVVLYDVYNWLHVDDLIDVSNSQWIV